MAKMAPLRLTIEDGKFVDGYGRQVILRGINVAGDAKFPSTPNQPSQNGDDFFDGDSVKFHARPFPREDAHIHFARLKRFGYNSIRYVFTWEAIEAAGPGIYDEEWIQHTIEILRVAKEYGFYIFMDPHQDVWSRFTGGSGAPMWTLYLAGLNPQSFAATEAAIVHNTYPDPEKFPKMIWATNYYRLAAATMFTLFFGGRDFAPKCIVDGKNIQDYLQEHFISSCQHLARRIHEAGDIENDIVFGWESMNEPSKGMLGYEDINVIPDEQKLKKGTCPTIWQTILHGSGRACEVDTYDMGGLGPYKVGMTLVDPHGEVAWLPADYDESRYNYKRDPGWKLGECIWAQHGVWNPSSDELLRKDYFAKHPKTGDKIDYPYFTNNYFLEFYRKYRDMVRSYHKDSIMLLQGPTLELPPKIKGTPDDDPKMVYAPHFYDGITLMTKKWNRVWNVDVLGILRGRYLTPAFGVKIGETAIRNCFRDQLAAMRKEGLDYMGNHPCMLTEFGIPYDMDDKHAYKTGDFSSQSAAMDANHYAVEGARMEGYALWLYMSENNHQWGDNWNGEDLSIFSVDDKPLPVSEVPREADASQSNISLVKTATLNSRRDADDDTSVTPSNLKRTLTTPSISSQPSSPHPELTNSPGLRAAEAYVRPAPIAVVGNIDHYTFDLKSCTLTLKLRAFQDATDDNHTVIFLPEFHFPQDTSTVEVSSGKWQISSDEEETVLVQKLRWWHGAGEQSIKITGLARKHNIVEGVNDEAGYYEQISNWLGYGNCSVM
ncbi:putative glycoside hydrolase family 5 protein [Phaeoacremonium minimum UCRPA7]|uniref:Putative glycoside hydrolase family 5 protein n=1 Tax=Phaeoacremonium minimum (strain UCR-PA7) TaxID=1286976 RepID=R8BRQ9_PHAM7|nr:putative glycoside hydrolase family 5 protein [Phaeoacremonium minimum UCRPA7]EOO01970.1 putative glycoside hydrolase family 5 protein [Phaeoacremonium minimum UCRPA7]